MRSPLTSVLLTLNDVVLLRGALTAAIENGSIYAGTVDDDEAKIVGVRVERVKGKLARAERRLKRKEPHDV
jgi:hypothetical protein